MEYQKEKKRQNKAEEICEVMAENILKVNDRLQARDPWNSESPKYDKYKTKSVSKPIIFKLQKTKVKEKILKETREGKSPHLQRNKGKNLRGIFIRNQASKKRIE